MAMDIKELNIGVSDYNSTEGFANIGLDISHSPPTKLNHDVTNKIPIDDSSIEFIYTSHLVEHLKIEDFYFFIKDCYRLLKEGGILRIVTPDLKEWVKSYLNNDQELFKLHQQIMIENKGRPWSLIDHEYVQLPADYFMTICHNWNHKWLFDYESISYHLKKCGFKNIINTGYRNSGYKDIERVEFNPEFYKPSLYIEVKK